MARRVLASLLVVAALFASIAGASADETDVHVGAIDAVLATPPGVEKPPVALLIAGSGPTDRDGNGPSFTPATLKKLSEQLALHGIASLRYDKRGARGWKPAFGPPEDFRFKDFVDDAVALAGYLRDRGQFATITLLGHSEGGLVAMLAAQRAPIDRLVLLTTAGRRQGDLLKAQLKSVVAPEAFKAIESAIDSIMTGQIVDPPPQGLSLPPLMQPGLRSAFVEDPIADLTSVRQPTLIIGGGRDSQVARLDFDLLAAAKPDAKTLWLPDMNHVLVDVSDNADNLMSYRQADRPLDPALVDAVTGFIAAGGR